VIDGVRSGDLRRAEHELTNRSREQELQLARVRADHELREREARLSNDVAVSELARRKALLELEEKSVRLERERVELERERAQARFERIEQGIMLAARLARELNPDLTEAEISIAARAAVAPLLQLDDAEGIAAVIPLPPSTGEHS